MDVNYYLKRIKNDKCVLFIGPEFPFLIRGIDRAETINTFLTERDIKFQHYGEDDFYYFRRNADRNRTAMALDELFEELPLKLPVSSVYDKLVEIPFSVIFSLSPEWFFKESYERRYGTNSLQSITYKKETKIVVDMSPAPGRPILYNIFGDVKNEDTLILDFDNLFDFFKDMFNPEIGLPERVETAVTNATDFIFLGFKNNAWYLKLLLRILQIKDRTNNSVSAEFDVTDQVMLFYKEHFQFEYLTLTSQLFIEKLHEACLNSNGLRTITSTERMSTTHLQNLVANRKIQEALDVLRTQYENSSEVISLYAQYMQLENDYLNKGVSRRGPEFTEFAYKLSMFINILSQE